MIYDYIRNISFAILPVSMLYFILHRDVFGTLVINMFAILIFVLSLLLKEAVWIKYYLAKEDIKKEENGKNEV